MFQQQITPRPYNNEMISLFSILAKKAHPTLFQIIFFKPCFKIFFSILSCKNLPNHKAEIISLLYLVKFYCLFPFTIPAKFSPNHKARNIFVICLCFMFLFNHMACSKSVRTPTHTEKILPFYGRQHPFTNFFPSHFTSQGIEFNCVEQYFHYMKALKFRDYKQADAILATFSPWRQKQFGNAVKKFNEKAWEAIRFDIMYRGNLAKFEQNQHLLKLLLDTGDSVLVEASPRDRIWGVGLTYNDPRIFDKTTWKGLNLQGEVLMAIRKKLRKN